MVLIFAMDKHCWEMLRRVGARLAQLKMSITEAVLDE